MTRTLSLIGAALFLATAAGAVSAAEVKNVVLVHGAFADGSGWQGVYNALKGKGYKVSIVQEPETSLANDVAATNRVIDLQDGPTVLVGHSWGGQIISEAGTNPKVAALVYVAALVPDVGDSNDTLLARMPGATRAVERLGDGYLRLDPQQFRADFAADVPEDVANFMAASQVLHNAESFTTGAKAAAWKGKPSYGVLAKDDRIINPELQRWMYRRANLKTTELSGSHAIFVSQPEAVAEVVDAAARAVK